MSAAQPQITTEAAPSTASISSTGMRSNSVLLLTPITAVFHYKSIAQVGRNCPEFTAYTTNPTDGAASIPQGQWLADGTCAWARDSPSSIALPLPPTGDCFLHVVGYLDEDQHASELGRALLSFNPDSFCSGSTLQLKLADRPSKTAPWRTSGRFDILLSIVPRSTVSHVISTQDNRALQPHTMVLLRSLSMPPPDVTTSPKPSGVAKGKVLDGSSAVVPHNVSEEELRNAVAALKARETLVMEMRQEVDRLKASADASAAASTPVPNLVYYGDFDERIRLLRGQELSLRNTLQEVQVRHDTLKAAASLPVAQRSRIAEAMSMHRAALTRLDEAAEATRKIFSMQHATETSRGLQFREFAESFAREVASEVADQVLTAVASRTGGDISHLPTLPKSITGVPPPPAMGDGYNSKEEWSASVAQKLLAELPPQAESHADSTAPPATPPPTGYA